MRYKRVKVYDLIELMEVSPVGIPSYPDAVNRSLIKSLNAYERPELEKLNYNTKTEIMEKQEVAIEEKPEEATTEPKPEEEKTPEETKEETPEEPKEEAKEEATEEEVKESVASLLKEILKDELKKLKSERGLVDKKKMTEKSIGELAIESGLFKI